jgi:hypothetical protein
MTAARRDPLPDFRALCESACIKLWGEPTSRDRKELRWNGCNAYSAKTFSFKKRAWYDHGAGWGGSTLAVCTIQMYDYPWGEQILGHANQPKTSASEVPPPAPN